MPLVNINIAKEMGYGMKAVSEGKEYTIVAHIGGNIAMACRASDTFPANVYLIAIDTKPDVGEVENQKPKDEKKKGGNGEDKSSETTPQK